ncbi:MAG: hypothetical protein LKF74_00370 [Megasphaera sp.]|jgi:hypothetical protein|nr:hypothetical protein [Megasphaera sp.]MCH4187064.1 hypothetical protein [Megasphaera sp.]MCH4217000.1 hypothetical protein [Megasphaera sp.]
MVQLRKKRGIKFAAIVIVLVVIAFIGWYFLYWVRTPGYSINLAREAIKSHDWQKTEDYIDVEGVYTKAFDDLTKYDIEEMGEDSRDAVQAIRDPLKTVVVSALTEQTKDYVENGRDEDKDGLFKQNKAWKKAGITIPEIHTNEVNYYGVSKTEKKDKTAVVTIKLVEQKWQKDFIVKLDMVQKEDGTWKIVSIHNFPSLAETYEKVTGQ